MQSMYRMQSAFESRSISADFERARLTQQLRRCNARIFHLQAKFDSSKNAYQDHLMTANRQANGYKAKTCPSPEPRPSVDSRTTQHTNNALARTEQHTLSQVGANHDDPCRGKTPRQIKRCLREAKYRAGKALKLETDERQLILDAIRQCDQQMARNSPPTFDISYPAVTPMASWSSFVSSPAGHVDYPGPLSAQSAGCYWISHAASIPITPLHAGEGFGEPALFFEPGPVDEDHAYAHELLHPIPYPADDPSRSPRDSNATLSLLCIQDEGTPLRLSSTLRVESELRATADGFCPSERITACAQAHTPSLAAEEDERIRTNDPILKGPHDHRRTRSQGDEQLTFTRDATDRCRDLYCPDSKTRCKRGESCVPHVA